MILLVYFLGMTLLGAAVYRYVGGGFSELLPDAADGRTKRLLTGIPALFIVSWLSVFLGVPLVYALGVPILFTAIMLAWRTGEIGCYYLWNRSAADGSLSLYRKPVDGLQKSLVDSWGDRYAYAFRTVGQATIMMIIASIFSYVVYTHSLWVFLAPLAAFVTNLIGYQMNFEDVKTSFGSDVQVSPSTFVRVEYAEYLAGLGCMISAILLLYK